MDPNTQSQMSQLGGMGAAASGNPYLIAGMVGLRMLEAKKRADQQQAMMERQAQVDTSNNMQRSLMSLANIGQAMRL